MHSNGKIPDSIIIRDELIDLSANDVAKIRKGLKKAAKKIKKNKHIYFNDEWNQ
jgi:hypothetical protein